MPVFLHFFIMNFPLCSFHTSEYDVAAMIEQFERFPVTPSQEVLRAINVVPLKTGRVS